MGNHTVGVIVLDVLMKTTDVAAVFAHPDNPDDGILYLSVKEAAKGSGVPVFQPGGKRNDEVEKIIREISPDLIVVADYRYLLKKEIIEMPNLGAINFHPSLLPKYRGRSPVNWAIINGEKESGLTVHYIDEGMDTGDIILQKEIDILFEDTIKDIHDKLFPVYADLANRVIELFKQGDVPRYKQDHSKATVFQRRTTEDGLIDWSLTNINIYNFVRAITYPYPGGFSFIGRKKYLIWSCKPERDNKSNFSHFFPGQICFIDDDGIGVRTGDGVVRITKIQGENKQLINFCSSPFSVGQKFTSFK